MTRLLFLTAEPWPTFRADVAALFNRHLPRQGIQADLVALGNAEVEPQWVAGQAWLHAPGLRPWRKHMAALLHGARGLLQARRGVHAAIQVRDQPLLALLGLVVARARGLPFFYWMSYPMPEGHLALARERGLRAGILRWLFPWLRGQLGMRVLYGCVLHRAEHVFVQSARMKQDLVARGVASGRMTPVPMGVDFEALAAAGVKPVDDPRLHGRRVLAYLGTLDRPRRIERLFEMLAIVRRQVPQAVLVLVGDCGDAAQRAALQQAAATAGVAEHVVWTGWLPTVQGWAWVAAAEVGLSPFPRSALLDSASPTKLSEYLALGLPVVGNDNPDQAEVIARSGGGICADYTAQAFADAVLCMLAMSGEARKAMADQGRAWVRAERDYRLLAARLAARYRELLGGESAPASKPNGSAREL